MYDSELIFNTSSSTVIMKIFTLREKKISVSLFQKFYHNCENYDVIGKGNLFAEFVSLLKMKAKCL